MARYFVFNNRLGARLCIAAIDNRMRELFAAKGYTVTAAGIVGKRATDGVDNPAAVTTTWAEPRQRLDGKWVVPHPEKHPMRFRNDPTPNRAGYVADVIRDRLADLIEEETPDWWPPDVGEN